MSAIHEIFKYLTEPLGDYAPRARTFVIDTQDADGTERYFEISVIVPPRITESDVVARIVNMYTSQGYIVDSVIELLDGYTYKELEALAETDTSSANRHVVYHY